MRRSVIVTTLLLGVPALARAHVTVNPRASNPGAEETYTVRVPTEKPVATTFVELEVPEGVTVSKVSAPEGATHEEKRVAGRIVTIIWTKDIKPKESAEFTFVAKNPATGAEITWKVHQRYSDGTVSDWSPKTTLAASAEATASPAEAYSTGPATAGEVPSAPQAGSSPDGAAVIETWLRGYDQAFNAKDLDKLATFYHPDVTIFEGGGVNDGWIDYRDHHLGPELKGFENLQFAHSNTKVHVLADGRAAYVTSEYSIKAKAGDRDVDGSGLETLLLVKADDGSWKIRHSHTSSRPRRPAGRGMANTSPDAGKNHG